MHIYLPIAELSVNIFLVLSLGIGVGMLSGIFGVGGGFLMTPLLILLGISPPVAVGTEANQILASSVSGVIAHWRRGNVDFKHHWNHSRYTISNHGCRRRFYYGTRNDLLAWDAH